MGPAWGCQRLRSVFKTMRDAMTSLLARDKVDAEALVKRLIADCAAGISDREVEALALAMLWQITINVQEEFAEARLVRPSFVTSTGREVEAKAEPRPKPKVEPPIWVRPLTGPKPQEPPKTEAALNVSAGTKPKAAANG